MLIISYFQIKKNELTFRTQHNNVLKSKEIIVAGIQDQNYDFNIELYEVKNIVKIIEIEIEIDLKYLLASFVFSSRTYHYCRLIFTIISKTPNQINVTMF